MHHRWLAISVAAVSAVLGPGVSGLVAPVAAASATASWAHATRATAAATTTNPATNVTPSPDYWPTCAQSGTSSQECIDAVVAAIDNARALEGVGPMVLPSGFASMSTAEQTFVVSNLERVDRGLAPAAGMVDSLDTLSADAATNDADPLLASRTIDTFTANGWGSIWAGDLNALAADYDWMYNDGWSSAGSINLDCPAPTDAGCWGHRDNILMPDGGQVLVTGVGSVVQSQWTSIAQILVLGTGTLPAFTVSWSDVTGVPTPAPVPAIVVPDTTGVTVTAPATVVAGHTARIVAKLTDRVVAGPVTGATVSFCRRAATAATATCSAATTDSTGTASYSARPTVATAYWLVFRGTTALVPVSSSHLTVHVRPAVTARSARTSTGWRVVASMTPVRGQPVRLQRHTTTGWVTVRRTTAHSSMSFGSLRSGSYRIVVSAVTGTLGAVAGVRAG